MINLCCTDFLTFVLLGQVVVTSTVRTPCVASERDTVLMVHGRCGGVRLDGDGGRKEASSSISRNTMVVFETMRSYVSCRPSHMSPLVGRHVRRSQHPACLPVRL